MKFAFNRQCVLEYCNVTRGHNDGDLPSYHLKFSCDAIPAEAAAFAIGGRSEGEIEQAMFAKDEPRFRYLDSIPTPRQFEAQHMLTINDLEPMRVIKLHKIELAPNQSGKNFSGSFSCSIENPDGETLYALGHMIHKSVQITLEHDRKDLADKADESAAKKKPAAVTKREGAEANGSAPAVH
jgi:hypothetical protein